MQLNGMQLLNLTLADILCLSLHYSASSFEFQVSCRCWQLVFLATALHPQEYGKTVVLNLRYHVSNKKN